MPKLSDIQLTDQIVRESKPQNRRFEIRDSILKGFMLRVSPTGAKSWYVQLDKNRKRKISDVGLLSASVARFRARDILVRELIAGGIVSNRSRPLSLTRFLSENFSDHRVRFSRYGRSDASRLVAAVGALGNERLDHIGVSKLERWKLERSHQVKSATVNREVSLLRMAFDLAISEGLIAGNPARLIKQRTTGKTPEPRTLSSNERARLLEVLSLRTKRFATLVLVALNTGLRRNELFSLRWKDVYFGPYPSLIVEKTAGRHHNRARRIPLNQSASDALQLWQAARSNRAYLVFPGPSGGPLKSIQHSWTRLISEAGISGFSFSNCRDDFAIRLIKADVSLTQVQELLGHSTISLTERYASFAPGKLSDAVAKLDLK